MGRVQIRLSGSGERTVVPDITDLYFTLDFTAPEKVAVNETLDDGLTLTVELASGDWALEVVGYADSTKTVPKVRGSASISVVVGITSNFDVWLTRDSSSGGAGSLSYSFGLPAGVQGWFALYPLDVLETVEEELWETDISASAGGIASAVLAGLPEGAYLAVVDLYHGGSNQAATWTRAAHIVRDDLTTLTHTFTIAGDFAGCDPAVGEGEATLAAKLDAALGSPSGSYTITLGGMETDLAAFTPKTLQVTGGKDIAITIRGNGQTVQLGSSGSLFTLSPGSGSSLKLVLQDVTLRGRNDNTSPLVRVNSRGTLEMKAGSLIAGNTSSSSSFSDGGGVFVDDSGTFTMSGGAVSGNSSSSPGGGVFVYDNGTFTMSGGAVSDNSSSYGSGVFVSVSGTFTMSGGVVSDNSSSSGSSSGGGVYVIDGGTFTMSGGAVSGNSAFSSSSSSSGGGVSVNYNGTFTMSDGAVSGNSASSSSSSGGGVYVGGGTFTMNGGAVSGNSSSSSSSYYSYGGGVYVIDGGTFTMSGGAVSDNSSSSDSSSYGGGVSVNYNGIFTMSGGAVSDNSSSYGGGVSVNYNGIFTMSDGEISGNSYSAAGGGVFVESGTFTMSGGAVSGNSPSSSYSSYGGGVYVAISGTFTMSGGAVSGNTAAAASYPSYGGGVCVADGTFSMSGGAVSDNILSGANSYGREVMINGTFKMSGDARPQRLFLSYNNITISGPLSGEIVPIDLGSTNSAPLTSWKGRPVLTLDSSYSSGDLAILKEQFTLGNVQLIWSPYTETAIPAEYTITDSGKLLSPPPSSSGISGITYSGAWTPGSDGRRKPPSTSDDSVTKERVGFTSTGTDAVIVVQLDVSSESDRDYAFISALDNDSATYNSDYFTGSRISGEAWAEVAIPVPTEGDHFIEICYRKDSSGRGGSDSAWFMIGESE
jgi:hypothetical protein